MLPRIRCLATVVVGCLVAVSLGEAAQDKGPATGEKPKQVKKARPKQQGSFTDPKEAGIDYLIQGEYVGKAEGDIPIGCQVIALGKGQFQAVVLPGGLPGAGWDGKHKILMAGKLEGEKTVFSPATGKRKYMAGPPDQFSATAKFPPLGQKDYSAVIANEEMTGKTDEDKPFTLKKVVRRSPTLGAAPPPGAIVLFDGKNADEWKEGRIVDGLLPVAANSKRSFKDFTLHIEFITPFQPAARSQGRGNSGVYLHGRHEIQVLDSFGLEGKNNECGGFYGRREPLVNMCFPPLTWQTYDVEFRTDPPDPSGKKSMAKATVYHNGVKIHDNLPFSSGQGPLHLQNHGNPVFYRNIWVLELKAAPAR
jgi:hypothetical protein